MNPLQHLIRERLRERGWSYGEVARRGGLARSTVYTLAATWNLARPPRPATIDALARGLGVPVCAVRAAAARSTGLYYYCPSSTQVTVTPPSPSSTDAISCAGAGPSSFLIVTNRDHRARVPRLPAATHVQRVTR